MLTSTWRACAAEYCLDEPAKISQKLANVTKIYILSLAGTHNMDQLQTFKSGL